MPAGTVCRSDRPDVDALDQGGEEGALACSGQLGPALPGSRIGSGRSLASMPLRMRMLGESGYWSFLDDVVKLLDERGGFVVG